MLLIRTGYTNTSAHSAAVATQAKVLAEQFGADGRRAEQAGWLHDISAIIPADRRLAVARQWGIPVLPAEETAPMLLHQKLSQAIAQDLFGVHDAAVLSAIRCHTTLKRRASLLDKVVFIADKVAWDQPGAPPYQRELDAALATSLNRAVLCYQDYLWQNRDRLAAVHPWFVAAYRELLSEMPSRTAGSKRGAVATPPLFSMEENYPD
jgi:predicted HD superfamily hydrolase involved in NAD metabolism